MKIVCIFIPHFPARVELQRNCSLKGHPFIIGSRLNNKSVVLDYSEQVQGVKSDMSIDEALSRCNDATLIEADDAYYLKAFDNITNDLLKESPIVEGQYPGSFFVEVEGLDRLYGGYANVLKSLISVIPEGLMPQIGVSNQKFSAYVAATKSKGKEITNVPGHIAQFLKCCSVDLLPISVGKKRQMHKFGLHNMGHVADLSLHYMQAQFGWDGRIAWEFSNGIDKGLINPVRHEEIIGDTHAFDVPTADIQIIMCVIKILLDRIITRDIGIGKYIRAVQLKANIIGRSPLLKKVTFKVPVNNIAKILFAIKGTLDRTDFPGEFQDVQIVLLGITGEKAIQVNLFDSKRKIQKINDVINQLKIQFGSTPPIYKIIGIEPWSRIPERRNALVHFVS